MEPIDRGEPMEPRPRPAVAPGAAQPAPPTPEPPLDQLPASAPASGRARLATWLRNDLRRPELPVARSERPFFVASAAIIVVVSQWHDPGTRAEIALVALAAAAFVARSWLPNLPVEPFAVLVTILVAAAVGLSGDLEISFFLLVILSLYAAWHLGSLVRATGVLVLTAAAPWLVAVVLVPEEGIQWTPWTAAAVFTFAVGRTLQRQRTLIAELEAARRSLAEQAVAEERRRIARELHDLAGHTLAAMLLHVTGARHVLRRDIDESERALRDAEAVGRASLDQIRVTVAALRTTERGLDPPVAGSADLEALIEDYRRAGLDIEQRIAPGVAGIGGSAGTALHRICREALSNVARHAPGNRVEVELAVDGDGGRACARVLVADHGRRPRPTADGPHFGVIGMEERARSLGGHLRAAPTADGWRVEATIPVGGPATGADGGGPG
jgi:signal transduction histidine kinase